MSVEGIGLATVAQKSSLQKPNETILVGFLIVNALLNSDTFIIGMPLERTHCMEYVLFARLTIPHRKTTKKAAGTQKSPFPSGKGLF